MQDPKPPGTPLAGQARKALGDLSAGLLLVLIAWAGLASVRVGQAQLQLDFDNDPGPYLVPELLLAVVGIGGLVLVLAGTWRLVRSGRALTPAPGWSERAPGLLLVVAFVASMALYLHLLFALGFRLATFVLCSGWILILTRQTGQRPFVRDLAISVLTAAVVVGAVGFVFKNLIRVPLP